MQRNCLCNLRSRTSERRIIFEASVPPENSRGQSSKKGRPPLPFVRRLKLGVDVAGKVLPSSTLLFVRFLAKRGRQQACTDNYVGRLGVATE